MSAAGTQFDELTLALKDRAGLFRAYMSYLKPGGIFVPTTRRYGLGDVVTVALTLPESGESERCAPSLVTGTVVWVTPPGALGHRTAGIGVQFADTSAGQQIKCRIELLLAATLGVERRTHTM